MNEQPFRGVAWTFLAYGIDRVIGLATTVVLARLLQPHDFGLIAIGVLTISFVNLFGNLGLGAAIIVRQELDRRGLGCVLTILLVTGVLTAGVMAALAPALALLFDEPRLTGILLALTSVVAISGLNWFYATLVQRELQFRTRFISVGLQVLVNSAVAIPLAATGAGVWSLVVGIIVSTFAYGAALLVLAPFRVQPTWDARLARSLVHTSRGFLLQGVTAFVQLNADYIIVGRVLGATRLGYYSTAYRIGQLPEQAFADPVARVSFPSFARMRQRGEPVVPSFLSGMRFVALVACPVGIVASGAADPFVRVLLGDKWLPAVGPVAVFGIWAAVRVIEFTIAWFLNSVGLAGVTGKISLVLLVGHIPALILAAWLGDITAVAWAMLGYIIVLLAAVALVASRRGGAALNEQWRAVRPVVLAGAVAWVVSRGLASLSFAAAPQLALAVAGGLASYAVVIWMVEPTLPRTTFRGLARAFRRAPAEG
jgi:O-antigen/teichoic acid export membrane protein